MNSKLNTVFSLVFILVIPIFVSAQSLNLAVIPFWTSNSDSIAFHEVYPRLYAAVRTAVPAEHTVLSVGTLDSLLGMRLKPDFIEKLNPRDLFVLNGRLNLDVLLFASLTSEWNKSGIDLKAVEFPTGHTIKDFRVQTGAGIDEIDPDQLSPLIEELQSKKTMFGFPFQESDFGIILFSDDERATEVFETVDQITYAAAAYADSDVPLVKVVSYGEIREHIHRFCDLGTVANEMLNGDLSLIWPESDDRSDPLEILVFASSPTGEQMIDQRLPYWPKIEDLNCFQVDVDSQFIDVLIGTAMARTMDRFSIFLPPVTDSLRYIEDRRIPALVTALVRNLPRIWAITAEEAADEADRTDLVDSAYRWLLTFFQDSALERAWIKINYSHFCHEIHGAACPEEIEGADLVFKQNADTTGLILASMCRATRYNTARQWDKAESAYREILQLERARGDSISVAYILYHLGMLAELSQNKDKALEYYERCANLTSDNGDHIALVDIYDHLGQFYRNEGRLEDSKACLLHFLDVAERLRSEPSLARAYFQLGITAFTMNQTEEALQRFRSATDYMEILADSLGLARVDNNIGAVYHKMGNLELAEQRYGSALTISRRIGDVRGEIKGHVNLGDVASAQKRWSVAHEHYEKALALSADVADDQFRASILYSKGLTLLKEGRLNSGYLAIREAIEMSGGEIHGSKEDNEKFLRKLEAIIGDIQDTQLEIQGNP